jgi:branched-chain amino acid aminotransferase
MSTAYINGRYLPFTDAALPLDDPGFVWGAVITDRCRTFRGEPFQLGEHVARFRRSCSRAFVPLTATDDELRGIASDLVRRDYSGDDLSVVFLATPGPTLIVHTVPVPAERLVRLWTQGATLHTRGASAGVGPDIKHRSRLGWWIASQQVQTTDANAEPLFVDARDCVLETPSANLVAVIDGQLTTAPRSYVLHGISLQNTHLLANDLGLTFMETPISPQDVRSASEVFLTNSTFCIAPVARIDDCSFPTAGPVLTQLQAAWTRLVGLQIGRPAS